MPLGECKHFGQHKTTKALFDAVVARYSSPPTAALGQLILPYLFPDLSAGGGSGGGQRQQQPSPRETPTPQQLGEWFAQRGASGASVRCYADGDCYLCVPPDPGIEAAALGASESSLFGTAPAEALHTFTHDSGASRCFFRDSITVTPLPAPVAVSVADPLGGPVLACSSNILPCPAVPSSSLSGLHLPSFSTNLVATAALQDAMVTTTTPRAQRVSICTCARTGRHLATFTRRPGSPPPLPPSPARPCLPCVEGQQRASPHSSSFPPTTAPLQYLHMDDVSVLRLHSDRGGEFSSFLLRDFCCGEGILQSFTLPTSPQQNGIAERRIGLVMEVARTSMIQAAAPHFLWPFAVRYAAHQLNLWPRVSLPETSPTLRWTGEVGDASVFRVWGSCAFVRDTSVDKLSSRAIPCGPAPPGVSQVDPLPSAEHVEVTVDSGAARGAASGGAKPAGAEPGGAEPARAEPGGAALKSAEPGGADSEGVEPGGAKPEGAEPGGAESEGTESGGAEPRGTASAAGPM
ncbi:unnamed protein product, partial [Closterium sp. NIES-54]